MNISFKKEAKLLMTTSMLLQFLLLLCKAVHLKEHQKGQMLRETTGGGPMVTRHGQRKNLRLRIKRETFEYIIGEIRLDI